MRSIIIATSLAVMFSMSSFAFAQSTDSANDNGLSKTSSPMSNNMQGAYTIDKSGITSNHDATPMNNGASSTTIGGSNTKGSGVSAPSGSSGASKAD